MKRPSPSSASPAANVPPKKPRSGQIPASPLDDTTCPNQSSIATIPIVSPAPPMTNPVYLYSDSLYSSPPNGHIASHPIGNRTIFFGSVNPSISLELIFDQITTGPIESARIVPEKNCAFVTFLNHQDAATFLSFHPTYTLVAGPSVLTLNWGKRDQDPIPGPILTAVQSGATRNVYIAGVPPSTSLNELYADVEVYGIIDQIRIVPPRENHTLAIAFVHFASIQSAINCVQSLPNANPKYVGRRIAYGKDRCAPNGVNSTSTVASTNKNVLSTSNRYVTQHSYNSHDHSVAGVGGMAGVSVPFTPYNHYPHTGHGLSHETNPSTMYTAAPAATGACIPNNSVPFNPPLGGGTIWPEDPTLSISGNLAYLPADVHVRENSLNLRVLYFGNLPSDTIPEDICNVVRAGLVERVHMTLRDDGKRVVFISFVDPRAATLMHYLAQTHGVVIRSRRVRVQWGKHTAALNSVIANAVLSANATRCVYVGGLASVCRSLVSASGGSDHTNNSNEDVTMMDTVASSADGVTMNPSSPNASTGTPSHLLPVLAEQLRAVLGEYGDIEVIYAPVDKPIAFVHFMELRSAIRAVSEAAPLLRSRFQGANLRIGYARDRCADPIKLPQAGIALGGAIPRRATGSFDPTNLKRSISMRVTNGTDTDALRTTGPNLELDTHTTVHLASLPPKPIIIPGIRDAPLVAASTVDDTPSPTVELHDDDTFSDGGHDDPAAGVREEMLDDPVHH